MRRKNLFLLLILAFFMVSTVSLTSCKKEKPKTEFTEFEQGLTNQDSIAVRNLVDQFFTLTKNGDYAGAAGMLYRTELHNKKSEPQLLNNEEIQEVEKLLKSVPMIDYKIEYIKFNQSYKNEVLCDVIIKKADGKGMPEIKTKMFFKPMRYLGQWCLALMNSEWGDREVVDRSKRDSMQKEYSAEMKAKKAEEKQQH